MQSIPFDPVFGYVCRIVPHCDRNGFAFSHPLEETDSFLVVCDVHPLMEGHILIIPKEHLPLQRSFFRTAVDRISGAV